MNFTKKNLIIFDLDGTLINSIPDLTLAINKMLLHYHLSPLTIAELTPFVGNGAKPLVQRALNYTMKKQEVAETLVDEAFKIYLSAYKEVTCKNTFLYPEVLETLKYLDNKGYKMAICTNKPLNLIAPVLNGLKIKQFFKIWVGEDSLAEKKPSALPLLHIIKELNTSLEKSIMVGDSKNDILASQNANIESIGVSYGYNYNENIANYNPTIVVDDFAELQKLF
ncbi:phosphoglycolate phosphatase [Polaribacter sp. KT25b]|uniref:phosphoglycolate phosphatase n=1 Tax=Polaribacter sp. KT25b TaxID=1855336 RepID=UPI000879B638|nr:phosphoglycolate phosphatase [Polaribacter sp. KT25b]SDS12481.1 phosphoglycolate phosphatase [Polaribacter sp. KT25b]